MPYKAVFTPFDKIFDAVKNGEADYGLIIHEGQITYEKHGFELAADLGKWWLAHTGLPLPLGIDIIRKDLGPETMRRFAELFRESIQYALNHRKEALKYASRFGRGLADDLNDRFVGMYVNDYTVELGANGEAGFRRLMDEAYAAKIIPHQVKPEFI
jgi:1,4-dihydroxy-6-naphthoate synthase